MLKKMKQIEKNYGVETAIIYLSRKDKELHFYYYGVSVQTYNPHRKLGKVVFIINVDVSK